MRQLLVLAAAVFVLAGSATTALPIRTGRQPVREQPARAPAYEDQEMPDRGPPQIWSVDLGKDTSSGIVVRAEINEGRAPIAVLRRGDTEVGRVAMSHAGHINWSGVLAAEPGDYRVTVTDGASPPETIDVTVRTLWCFGGKRLVARRVAGRLVRAAAVPLLELPRWHRQDQDYSFVVEWLRDGKRVHETTGRTDHLLDHLQTIEGMYGSSRFETMCSHELVETYRVPEVFEMGKEEAAGAWEVRVHREGAESVAARFEIVAGDRVIAVPFAPMASGGRRVRRGASPEVSHGRTGASVVATAAEYRALLRDPEVFAIRTQMAAMLGDEGPLDRPDFEYDRERSPDANWHRRKAWEKRDSERQFSNERTLAARARKHRPALAARVKTFGGPWTAEETPAPVPAAPAR